LTTIEKFFSKVYDKSLSFSKAGKESFGSPFLRARYKDNLDADKSNLIANVSSACSTVTFSLKENSEVSPSK